MSSKAAADGRHTKPTPADKAKGKARAIPVPKIQRPPTPDTSGSPGQQENHDDDEAASDSSDESDSVAVAPSRTPRTRRPSIKLKLDKGKQRAMSQDQAMDQDEFVAPKSRLPRKRATPKRDVFDSEPKASGSQPRRSPKVLTTSKILKQSSQARASSSKIPVKISAKEAAPPPSSAVRARSHSRARTSSVIPGTGEVWSAIKPVPLKTVLRSSPPRIIKISDSASSASGSDDEFLLRASRSSDISISSQKSKNRRKPNAGEFEWDEKSRSCIVKRERSRSRSLAARSALDTGPTAKNEYAHSDEEESGINDASQMEDASAYQNSSNILNGLHDDPAFEEAQNLHDNYQNEGLFDQHLPLEAGTHEQMDEDALPIYDFTNGGDASSSIAGSDSESEDDAFERSVQQIPLQDMATEGSMMVDSNDHSQSGQLYEQEERPTVKEESDDVVEQDSFLDSFQEANSNEDTDRHPTQEQPAAPDADSTALAGEEGSTAAIHALSLQREYTKPLSIRDSKIERRSTSPLPPSSPPPLPISRESTASNEIAMQCFAQGELLEDGNIAQPVRIELQAALSVAVQSTPISVPTKSLQAAGMPEVMSQGHPPGQTPSPSGGPALVVASSSSPRLSNAIIDMPQILKQTRGLTPTLRVSNSRPRSPNTGGLDENIAPSSKVGQRELARHLSPGLGQGCMPSPVAQNRMSPFAKLEGLLSPKAGIRRSVSRSPSPFSQASRASPEAPPSKFMPEIAGSYRSPRQPRFSTSPQPAPLAFVRELVPRSPAHHTSVSLFSTPARLRTARSVSPLLTPNQAHASQPQASLLQMLRTAALTTSSKQAGTSTRQAAPSSSLVTNTEGPIATQDAVTTLSQRIDRYRRSISVEVQEAASVSRSYEVTESVVNAAAMHTAQSNSPTRGSMSPGTTPPVSALREVSPSLVATSVAVPATPNRTVPSQDVGLSTPARRATKRTDRPSTSASRTLQSPARIDSSAAANGPSKQASVHGAHKSTPNAPLPGRSPALQRALAPLDSPQLSPNVTVRRGRSASYSSASTMSVRSKLNTPREEVVRGRKLSFTELGSFDSSPLSVAASIGCHSFEALDGNSDDEDDPATSIRPSPSKELAQQQKKVAARFDSTLSSSSSEESEEEDRESDEDVHSMLAQTSQQVAQASETVSSTPAKKITHMTSSTTSPVAHMPTTSTPGRTKALHNPSASSQSPALRTDALPVSAEAEADEGEGEQDVQENSMFVEAGSFDGSEDAELPSLLVEGCSSEAELVSPLDQSGEGDSSNMSIVLDAARPRSGLVPPPLTKHSRPIPGRRRSRPSSNLDTSDADCVQDEGDTSSIQVCSPAPQRARSASTFSRAESVISNMSTIVQVSSNDPKAAARAAAILKIHHKYIQEGNWPTRSPDLAEQSGNSPEGERVLDELLKEAELEVSMYTENFETTSQMDNSVESEETKPNQSLLPGRTVRHGTHRLAVWTRHDWRNLEQCFIDERRRTKLARIDFDASEVLRIFLENEQLALADCVGEWDTGKILLRVEALQARKELKQEQEASQRARSTSFVSSVWSRAPSDFLSREDSRIGAGNQSTSTEEGSFLQIPGGLAATGRRYARSAEPQGKVYEKRDGYSHLSSRHPSTSMRDGIHRRAASLTDVEAMPQLRKPQPLSSRVSKLYPPLDDLAAELRPKKAMPIKGRSVLAAVNMFERIEEEQSLEVVKSRVPKRKDISDTVSESGSSKRVRI